MSVSAEKSFVRCSEEQWKYNLRPFSAMRTAVRHFNQKMKSKEEGECIIQTKACMMSLTLQSSQHCPWAHTASPLRVHVVALQHGFIHS